jgi:hypothetical protein
MDQPGVQQIFFQHVKSNLASHISLVDEIADLLHISSDSAYRRIRGEKSLSFEELKKLCAHYKISLDQLFHQNNNSFLFSGPLISNDNFGIDMYLQQLLDKLNFFISFERRELYYIGKDLSIFHCFGFHELTVFQIFFWMKSIIQYPMDGKELMVLDSLRENVFKMTAKLIEAYNRVPSLEIWNDDSLNATIRQIDYYKQNRVFPSDQYVVNVYRNLMEMIDHIEKQAEAGCKFPVNGKPTPVSTSYKFYVNDFLPGEDCNLAILNDAKVVYINHSFLNIIMTRDPVFSEYIYQHTQNIIRKSTLMSDVGEKDRKKFFNGVREKIESRIKVI